MKPDLPESFPKRILLLVSGITPQIITETLYALAVKREPAFIPTRVISITTALGAKNIKNALLHPQTGHFHRLCKEYGLSGISFAEDDIFIIEDEQGNPLKDIRTVNDNERCANMITNIVYDLTSDPDSAIHISIAGGRKTMGFYIGYAASLFGREQDRLSHVLVSEEFEGLPEFFYPSKHSRTINGRDKTPFLDASQADVSLAEIPFARLRDGMVPHLGAARMTFSQAVHHANTARQGQKLRFEFEMEKIRPLVGPDAIPLELEHTTAWFYAWMAYRAKKAMPPLILAGTDKAGLVQSPEDAQSFIAFYQYYTREPLDEVRDRFAKAFAPTLDNRVKQPEGGMKRSWVTPLVSKIRNALEAALGPALAEPYLIHSKKGYKVGNKPAGCYQIRLAPQAISLE